MHVYVSCLECVKLTDQMISEDGPLFAPYCACKSYATLTFEKCLNKAN